MLTRNSLPVGTLSMILVLSLAILGVAYGLWSNVLTIEGTVNTGEVNAEVVEAFTDDDDKVDEQSRDRLDQDDCQDIGGVDRDGDGLSSCDPADRGRDPKPRFDKDVARCDALLADEDADQPGNQNAAVEITNGYPSYFCTAWFAIHNNGTIPVKVQRIDITDGAGNVIVPDAEPSTIYDLDLDGDGRFDLNLHFMRIRRRQQIDPSERITMELDMHVKQDAPQRSTLRFGVLILLAQWNEAE